MAESMCTRGLCVSHVPYVRLGRKLCSVRIRLKPCVCVCVCVRASERVCVCVYCVLEDFGDLFHLMNGASG